MLGTANRPFDTISADLKVREPHSRPALSRFLEENEPPAAASPHDRVYRCGHCLMPAPEVQGNPVMRCPHCHGRNALPSRLWINCDSCGFEQRVRTRRLAAEPRCISCGHVLAVEDVLLTPLHRHNRHRSVSRQRRRDDHRPASRHDQALMVLLVFGAAILLSLKLLSQL
ncbi:MAG: hypothetical protein ABIG44_04970 [Planctomycetota bacterium]